MMKPMRLSVTKELHLTPWDLLCALRKAGLVDEHCCAPAIKLVARTEVNEGRTVIVQWSLTQKNVTLEDKEIT